MTEQLILHHLFLMPEALKQEALHYILYLSNNYEKDSLSRFEQIKPRMSEKKPVFGYAKGKYILSSDFDAPLEDFNDYM